MRGAACADLGSPAGISERQPENSALETLRRSGDTSRSPLPGASPRSPRGWARKKEAWDVGDTGLRGPERPAPFSVLSPSWRCWPFAWAVACLASGASWQHRPSKAGSARPAWVPGRVRTCSGSLWSFSEGGGGFFLGLVSGGLRVLGAPGGPGPAGCGPRCRGACPTALGQGARPTLQREPQSQQDVNRERGLFEGTDSGHGGLGEPPT